MAAVDVADHVGIGGENHILVDHARAGNGRAAGVDDGAHAVLARPGHRLARLVRLLHRAETDFGDAIHADGGQLGEVGLAHAALHHHRAGMHLHAGGMEGTEGALGSNGQRLGADHVPRPTGQVHLAHGDELGDAAVDHGIDPADLVLAGRPVAEHRMGMAVDEARRHRRATSVDHRVRALGVALREGADGGDPPALAHQGIGVENGVGEVAGKGKPDVADDKLAGRRRGLVMGHGWLPVWCGAQTSPSLPTT